MHFLFSRFTQTLFSFFWVVFARGFTARLGYTLQRRCPRQAEETARLNDFSYSYKVHVHRKNKLAETPVCFKGFQAMFVITARRLNTIKTALGKTGMPPIDKGGKHKDQGKQAVPQSTYDALGAFFSSLKGRKAHYSLKDRLPLKYTFLKILITKKLFEMFYGKNPGIEISAEKFRTRLITKCNIGFGNPCTDTCSTCDSHKVKEANLEKSKLNTSNADEIKRLDDEIKTLHVEMELHKKKSDWFYKLKRQARRNARKHNYFEAITMDFGKNHPVPNLPTNDVYYW